MTVIKCQLNLEIKPTDKRKIFLIKYSSIGQPGGQITVLASHTSHLLHEDPVSLGELLQPHHPTQLLRLIFRPRLHNNNILKASLNYF